MIKIERIFADPVHWWASDVTVRITDEQGNITETFYLYEQ